MKTLREIVERQVIEEHALVGGGVHAEGILEEPWSSAEVHIRIPHAQVPGIAGDAAAELGRLFDEVVTEQNAGIFFRGDASGAERRFF